MTSTWLIAQLIVTPALAGLIGFVQLVHYPLLSAVGIDRFESYEREHVRRTGWIAAPLMLIEAISAVGLVLTSSHRALPLVGLVAVALIWISTFAIQVPCHRRLSRGFDAGVHRSLVRSNWLRTGLWGARTLLVILIATQSTAI